MSSRYIHDRKLPDKAIDVIDESGAAQMLLPESRRKRTIGLKEIETTIATMARIPPKAVSKDDAEVLRHLEETLKRVVYGQDKAIEALSASIKLARAGLREPEKPIGCYLFGAMVALLSLFLNLLIWPLKSTSRLEAENPRQRSHRAEISIAAILQPSIDIFAQ